jgi:hypothetical protein
MSITWLESDASVTFRGGRWREPYEEGDPPTNTHVNQRLSWTFISR